ncbi:MAG: hypothetical protein CMM84_18815 [Rhodothermaceae bacterium]|nr:hypothetical protein [Rhodothermaceae bacterium]MBC13322.1 hypothetical protein [Rhodothermaceae bacterium]MBC13372.1 hypothetical protein [Rhodothermaceae bacterium]MBC15080.1 hypothetical protein [Rhodothermaceae bacterium]MBC15387.1 hypothetical protein [Rhodothermaceae bacterium]
MIEGPGDSPQYVLDRLEPARLRAARERAALTGVRLADKVGVTPSAISQFESGAAKPDLDTLVRLSMALAVPTTFFAHRERDTTIPFDACHFRARRRVSQRDRRASVRNGEVLLDVVEALESRGVGFPQEEVRSFWSVRPPVRDVDDLEAAEAAASALRRHWGMGYGPIPDLVRVLESKGVFVLPLSDAHTDVDAYSAWAGQRPCVMLSMAKSASRARFDASHELAHLVMHDGEDPGSSAVERQADRFAGAFLAPREGFMAECPRRWSLEAFARLKGRWRMSIQALVRRAYDLGALSKTNYQKAFREMSARGMRADEPGEWEHERPVMVSQALRLLQGRMSVGDLASEIGLHPGDMEQMLRRIASAETVDLIAAPRPQPHALVRPLHSAPADGAWSEGF